MPAPLTPKQLQTRINAAQGRIPCDLIISNVQFLDVFSCKWRRGDVAIIDGVIVGLERGLKAKRTINAKGKWLVPGFIDAHVHLESSLMTPTNFQSVVLSKGTTTAVCDPHELTNVIGADGIKYFLNAAETLDLDLRVMMSSCVPATSLKLETNGAGILKPEILSKLSKHPKALGLAEVMNVPGVLNNDPNVLKKLSAFSDRPIDGHCPQVTGLELSAYASCGISSCHESSQLHEAQEKLTKGIACWIREGSVAKDLEKLIPLLTIETSTSIGFCTDDRNPLDIAQEGHLDHLVRLAIKHGVLPEIAYRSASWSVARHYGLKNQGVIAPGYRADLVLLSDAKSCSINQVFCKGIPVSELALQASRKQRYKNTMNTKVPEARELEGSSGKVHVMGVHAGSIITDRHVMKHDALGVARLSVLERYGKCSKPANAYVLGFGTKLRGAIASSVGHDSHNLIVVGSNTEDMRTALASLIEAGGGFSVVQDKTVKAILPLPFGGLMTPEDPSKIEKALSKLRHASHAIGCDLPEPFLQLAFLSLPVIPSLKLTDKGLIDVNAFKIIEVRA